jgi:hypothetical protein
MRVRGKIDLAGLVLKIPTPSANQVFQIDYKTPPSPKTPESVTVEEMENPQRTLPSTAILFKSLSVPAPGEGLLRFLYLYDPSPSPQSECKEEVDSDGETASYTGSDEEKEDNSTADSCYDGLKRRRLT